MNRPLVIKISYEVELAKVIAFLRAGCKNVKFKLAKACIEPLLAVLQAWATESGLHVRLTLRGADRDRMLRYGLGAAAAGGAIGWGTAGLPGMVLGTAVGGVLGVAIAHVKLQLTHGPDGDAELAFT